MIDVRGSGGGGGGGGGGGIPGLSGIPRVGGGLGVVIVIVVVAIQVFGGSGGGGGYDIGPILGSLTQGGEADPSQPDPLPAGQDPQRDLRDFSGYVFTDAQDEWARIMGGDYKRAELVLYDGAVRTGGCGSATSAVGPFYCPGDSRVYLDLSFYDDMKRELRAGGDFAWAYVIAHELGHHVQNLAGISDQVDRATQQDPGQANALSVRLELQADCYAGVWGRTVFKEGDLEAGDLDEAFTASEAVGDDRLQEQAGGSVNPDTFTHGTSEQRQHWFQTGYDSGDPARCDTFSAASI
ncbi:MAG: uncharacterized protein QOG62_2609 [Thermoleophilaceae bacterium]|nr:uncharacterized protein [Thermoleophilaceae bacterium]